jgi:hypothetical protein
LFWLQSWSTRWWLTSSASRTLPTSPTDSPTVLCPDAAVHGHHDEDGSSPEEDANLSDRQLLFIESLILDPKKLFGGHRTEARNSEDHANTETHDVR